MHSFYRCWESLWPNSSPILDKSTQGTNNWGVPSQHSKICIPKANILSNGEALETLSLRSGIRQELNVVLNVLANEIRQGRSVRGIRMGQEEVKLPLVEEYMIVLWKTQSINDKTNSNNKIIQ